MARSMSLTRQCCKFLYEIRLSRRGEEAVSAGIFSTNADLEEENLIRSINASNASIRGVCKSCTKAAVELLEVLEKPRVHSPNRRWNSFRSALKSVWDERKIEELLQRLQGLWAQLDSAVFISLRYSIYI